MNSMRNIRHGRSNQNLVFGKFTLDAFEKVFGKRPEVTEIHAGLECGLLAGKSRSWTAFLSDRI